MEEKNQNPNVVIRYPKRIRTGTAEPPKVPRLQYLSTQTLSDDDDFLQVKTKDKNDGNNNKEDDSDSDPFSAFDDILKANAAPKQLPGVQNITPLQNSPPPTANNDEEETDIDLDIDIGEQFSKKHADKTGDKQEKKSKLYRKKGTFKPPMSWPSQTSKKV